MDWNNFNFHDIWNQYLNPLPPQQYGPPMPPAMSAPKGKMTPPPGPGADIPVPPLPPDLLGEEQGPPADAAPNMAIAPMGNPATAAPAKGFFENVMDKLQNDPLTEFGIALMGSKENRLGAAFADAQTKLNAWRKSRAEEGKLNAETENKKADTAKTTAEAAQIAGGKKIISVVPAGDGYYAVYADGSTKKVTSSTKASASDILHFNKLRQDAMKNAITAKDPITGNPLPEAKRQQLLNESMAQIDAAEKAMQSQNGPVPPKDAPSTPTATNIPSQEDLEFTAKKYGITVDEVKKKLNIQ
jgi:hypothetical protein